MLTLKNVLLGTGIIITDLFIYIVLGIALMDYDDFYNEQKGEYFSLTSMTTFQQVTYISLNIWNVVNIAAIIFVIYRIIRRTRNRQHRPL